MNDVLEEFLGKRVNIGMIDRHGDEPSYNGATILYVDTVWAKVSYDNGAVQFIRISEIETITFKAGEKRG